MHLREKDVSRSLPEFVDSRVPKDAGKRREIFHHSMTAKDGHSLTENIRTIPGGRDLLEHDELPDIKAFLPGLFALISYETAFKPTWKGKEIAIEPEGSGDGALGK